MKARFLVTAAVVLAVCSVALVTSGCSQAPLPPPTVNGAAIEASAAAAAIRGSETPLTVTELVSKLKAEGFNTKRLATTTSGLFLPAKYEPITVDKSFVQTYYFKNAVEAQGAASTVDTDGAVLGATPDQLINVHWSGQSAFFRSGRLVVIFVSQKPAATHLARDTRVYSAFKAIMGKPFAGTFLDSPGATSTATPL